MGSISDGADGAFVGSEGPMTRARRRRLLVAQSSGMKSEASAQDLDAGGPQAQEWRDWANLTCELVEDIADRLLSDDVSEFYRFRAVCRPWRDHTADQLRGRGALQDRRFRPRNWVVLAISTDAGPRRRLLNMATGSSLSVNLPALTTHCHLGAVDGLLVLIHRFSMGIRLLDPLSNAVIEFPAITSLMVTTVPLWMADTMALSNPRNLKGHSINGACLDESTSLPTLVACVKGNQSCIVVAKPGDPHWTLVNPGRLYHSPGLGKITFNSLLSHGGRCYAATLEGSIFLLELLGPSSSRPPPPRLVEIISQRQHATRHAILFMHILSYLVGGGGNGRMLLVRYWRDVEYFGGRGAYNPMELFTVADGTVTGRIEVLEVDIAGRMLVPVWSLGHHAAFIGRTHSMLVCTKTFPSIAADAVYLGHHYQCSRKFSVIHLKTRKAEPPHEFGHDENKRIVPSVRPCNLDQYLVCHADHVNECINGHVDYASGQLLFYYW